MQNNKKLPFVRFLFGKLPEKEFLTFNEADRVRIYYKALILFIFLTMTSIILFILTAPFLGYYFFSLGQEVGRFFMGT
ncbi:hypothetical protein COW36_03425 [bacterium (Candidatus Blackallbacteria) CG17_big_fil_post_rev_8_21_14_2_50_48_46]|uniref:Uncharacterized protein n=1 Tax=bacterium (Candidatus Blackallbacteria) CG17_big_fil_post_rev_8_21_14_2_50_48_46 TaxID=2014261 RepID=A0A2M7G9G8_9BACT|nr:MAG: hypothetical protein COW64_25845 [bacterium (Candidatus Blackallbacteria) CG18_big_fil_WC_8_21_14_2_50_49_26]PIW18761.1 MAG: hypothetical protein COW36_03425 [bacterium (Candidatus Blackallbacteria) CG17_big_fil_post_rev_8_21_14_2_50_48_46]